MLNDESRNDSVAVGTASVLVSPEKARKELIITNTSTGGQIITLGVGQAAAALRGIVLTPYGVYYASMTNNFNPTTQQIFAIASAAGGTLAVFER